MSAHQCSTCFYPHYQHMGIVKLCRGHNLEYCGYCTTTGLPNSRGCGFNHVTQCLNCYYCKIGQKRCQEGTNKPINNKPKYNYGSIIPKNQQNDYNTQCRCYAHPHSYISVYQCKKDKQEKRDYANTLRKKYAHSILFEGDINKLTDQEVYREHIRISEKYSGNTRTNRSFWDKLKKLFCCK